MTKDSGQGNQKSNIIIAVLFLVIIVLAVLLFVKTIAEDEKSETIESTNTANDAEDVENVEKWQEGAITYNGRKYCYNTAIKTYLFMGIDNDGVVGKAADGISGGQSDSMFLLVENSEEETLSIIAINRNAMTLIDTYDEEGNYLGQITAQICLQHGYGDGMRTSCIRSVDAVSRLFYNLPISGYIAINMGAIQQMNDSVGGVTVEVMQDLENESMGVSLKQGETVTLSGDEAYVYLRSRDIEEFDSATRRLERQQQYLIGFMAQAKRVAQADESAVLRIYNSIEAYLVTNMDFDKLAGEALDYTFDESQMYTVPGETIMGDVYEEFYIDEDEFYQMVIDIFYKPVEE